MRRCGSLLYHEPMKIAASQRLAPFKDAQHLWLGLYKGLDLKLVALTRSQLATGGGTIARLIPPHPPSGSLDHQPHQTPRQD